MTDRFNALTVVLDHDIREDDAEVLIQAIKMLKGVVDVKGNVADVTAYAIEARVRNELAQKLLDVVSPK